MMIQFIVPNAKPCITDSIAFWSNQGGYYWNMFVSGPNWRTNLVCVPFLDLFSFNLWNYLLRIFQRRSRHTQLVEWLACFWNLPTLACVHTHMCTCAVDNNVYWLTAYEVAIYTKLHAGSSCCNVLRRIVITGHCNDPIHRKRITTRDTEK